jgi:hypothetical protein
MGKKSSQNKPLKMDAFKKLNQLPVEKRGDFSVFEIENDLQKTDNKDFNTVKCGNIHQFDDFLKAYEKSKSSFKVISYGTTKKIIYGKSKFLFSGIKGEKKPQGLHLIGMVKRDIDALITKNPDIIPSIPKKKPNITQINLKNIEWFGTGVQALAIDVNHCYWRTAFLLGFITKQTYFKGIERQEYKDGRLIAIGTLGKMLSVSKYENGIKVADYIDDTDYLKYGGFFWKVLEKVYELYLDLQTTLKEDFLMFLTDCVVIDESKRDVATAIMVKHGYSTKENFITFTDINDKSVCWITDKGEEKQILHYKMIG